MTIDFLTVLFGEAYSNLDVRRCLNEQNAFIPMYAVRTLQGTFDLVVSVIGSLPFWNGPCLSAIMAGNAMVFENALDICGVDSAELMGAIQFMQGVTESRSLML
jgi:hypothetical protein